MRKGGITVQGAETGNGIYVTQDITITDAATVSARSGYPALYVEGNATVTNKAAVQAESDDATLYVLQNVEVEDATVDATSTTGSAVYCQKFTARKGNIIVNGAETGNGINAQLDMSLTDKTNVRAEAGYPALYSKNDMTVQESIVNARSTDSVALFTQQQARFEGSRVHAESAQTQDGILASNGVSVDASWIWTTGAESYSGVNNSVIFHGKQGQITGQASVLTESALKEAPEASNEVTIQPDESLNFAENTSLTIPEGATLRNQGHIDGYIQIRNNGTLICESHTMQHVAYNAATCTEEGNVEYWHCRVCGENYAEEQGTTKLETTIIPAGHQAQKVDAKKPTSEAPGNIEYWYCEGCDKCFADQDLMKEISKESTVLKQIDKSKLQEVLRISVEAEEKYTPETWSKYAEVRKTAETINADLEATQEQVDEATDALQGAIGKLVKRGDKTKLNTAIAEAVPAEDKGKYTEDSWTAYQNALEAAMEVQEDPNATQEQVDEAKAALETAKTGLEPALPFEDVVKGDASHAWFYDAVVYNYMNNYMQGKTDTKFAPFESIPRAQFAVILHRLENEPEVIYTDRFPDVADGEWYTKAIMWASSVEIVNGYENTGMFGLTDSINREQMATMMYRYAKYKEYDLTKTAELDAFVDDADVNAFAEDAMKWAVGNEIITGKDIDQDGIPERLDPQGYTSRAECAIIIQRFMEKQK